MAHVDRQDQEGGAAGTWRRYRLLIILALLAVALLGWLYISKAAAVREAEERAAAQRAELVKQAGTRHAETVKQSLMMFSMPLAWAIRRELMADNLDQVDQYVSDLIKQKGFEKVLVAKADGAIVVASDRKDLGAAFSSVYPARHLNLERISIEETSPGLWQVVIPIMGLNARLGMVAFDYRAPPAALDGKA